MIESTFVLATIALGTALRSPTKLESWALPLNDTPSTHYLPVGSSTIDSFIELPASETEANALASTTSISRLDFLKSELASYSELEHDWDGEGGNAPSEGCVRSAITLLQHIPPGFPLPKPMISSSGKVGLYWKTTSFIADIEIESDFHFSLFAKSRTEPNKKIYKEMIGIDEDTNTLLTKVFSEL